MRGRKKKYGTAKALRSAVQDYFDCISCMESVMKTVPTGMLDRYGHAVTKQEPVLNAYGKPVEVRFFYVPPERYGLVDHLGISIDTWTRYSEDPMLSEVVTWTEEQIEGWKTRELLRRENKHTAGLIWEMERNHKRKQEDDSAGRASPMIAMTDSQLIALAAQIGEG